MALSTPSEALSENPKKKAAKKPTKAEKCLDRFLDTPKRVAPEKDAKATRTHRARIDGLTKKKIEFLDFVHGRLRQEAPRVAACQLDQWERTGRIDGLAGKHKFANLPGAYLGQGLWAQVAGQMKSWISNAENELIRLLRQAAEPRATHRLARARALMAHKKDFVGPWRPRPPLSKKERRAIDVEIGKAEWAQARDEPVERALADFQALGLDLEAARKTLFSAMRAPARRVEVAGATPAERLARALWLFVIDKCPPPSWNNLPFWVHPRMGKILRGDELAAGAKPARGEKGRKPNPAQTARRNKRHARPKARHCFLLTIPERSEWPTRKALVADWRLAVREASAGLETDEQKQDRLKAEKKQIAAAKKAKQPLPVFEDPFKGYAKHAKMTQVAIPFFAGEDFDELPGKTALSFALLAPRADKRGRSEWSGRIVKKLDGQDLAKVAGTFGPQNKGKNSKTGVVGIDAGIRTAMSTSVGAPGGSPPITTMQAFEGGERAIQLSLDFLLPGWRQKIEPMAIAVKDLSAGRQKRGQKVRNKRRDELQTRLTGTIKIEIETACKRLIESARPAAVCAEDLDLRGGRFSADTNRVIQMMGHGVMRDWLERHAVAYGYKFWREPAAFSSQQCNACRWIDRKNRKDQDFHCLRCGHTAHADANAALCLRERFLFAQWLLALGPRAAELGLERASIEEWMRPSRIFEALWRRERFLSDEARVSRALDLRLLPPAIEQMKIERKGGVSSSRVGQWAVIDWLKSASFRDHGGAHWAVMT